MSKPIDQEREAFALIPVERSYDMRAAAILHYNTARKSGADLDDALDAAWRATLAKAHQPDDGHTMRPAGVAVPDGWKLVPVELTEEMRAAFNQVDQSRYVLNNRQLFKGRHAWSRMLAVAPHPVSGERKSERSDAFYAGLYHKSSPMWHRLHDLAVSKGYDHVQFAIECAPVYKCDCMGARKVAIDASGKTMPCECVSAAQDVAGLVEALEQISKMDERSVLGSIPPIRQTQAIAMRALAAHRAQQGE